MRSGKISGHEGSRRLDAGFLTACVITAVLNGDWPLDPSNAPQRSGTRGMERKLGVSGVKRLDRLFDIFFERCRVKLDIGGIFLEGGATTSWYARLSRHEDYSLIGTVRKTHSELICHARVWY